MRKYLIFISLLFAFNYSFSQAPYYFITDQGDTTFCKEFEAFTNLKGKVTELNYTSMDGKDIVLKKPETPIISSYYDHSEKATYDLIPFNANKNNDFWRYEQRILDVPIMVWLHQPRINQTLDFPSKNPHGMTYPSASLSNNQYGVYHFTIQLEDGRYAGIEKRKVFKEALLPLLQKCPEIKILLDDFKMPVRIRHFDKENEEKLLKMIRVYNHYCAASK